MSPGICFAAANRKSGIIIVPRAEYVGGGVVSRDRYKFLLSLWKSSDYNQPKISSEINSQELQNHCSL